MVIFNSYVKLPEGNEKIRKWFTKWRKADRVFLRHPGGSRFRRTFNEIAGSNMTKSAGTPFFSAEKIGEKGQQIRPKYG